MASRTRSSAHPAAPADAEVDAVPWIAEGILSGVVGAGVIAAIFAGIDLAAGRLLWTPFALGSGLFLGAAPAPDAPVSLGLVGAYTAVHTAVFVSIGLLASFLLIGTRWPGPRAVRVLALATALFVAFGAMFGVLAVLLGAPPHGIGRILAANAVAALAMAATLVMQRDRRAA